MWMMVLLRWYKRASSMNQETGNVKYVYEIIHVCNGIGTSIDNRNATEFWNRVPDDTTLMHFSTLNNRILSLLWAWPWRYPRKEECRWWYCSVDTNALLPWTRKLVMWSTCMKLFMYVMVSVHLLITVMPLNFEIGFQMIQPLCISQR